MNNFTQKLAWGLVVAILLLLGFSQWRPVQAAPHDVNCNAPGVICKSGALTNDETWQAGNVYVIMNDLTVGPAATLTIEAGAIVKFAYYCCDRRNFLSREP